MALIPVNEALERILEGAAASGEPEMLPLAETFDRVLARDLMARRTHPPFAASAMDGYAVRAEEAQAGAILRLQGESAAGHGFDGALDAGAAIRIFTGAPLPQGADAIVIQEVVDPLAGGTVRINETPVPGRHIRDAGIDFTEGRTGLAAGRLLDAGAITFAAAMNHATLPVVRRPKVAILATGDELRLPGQTLGPGQIIASNSFGVAALARGAGAVVLDLGIAADRMEALDEALDSAIAHEADVLVTIGGASVGDHDLVQEAMTGRGMALDFWKIAMRPGKPLMSGKLGRMRVLGLPGNPASSLVCGHLFLEPLLTRLGGRPDPDRIKSAILSKDLPENDLRQDYLRGSLATGRDGQMTATPSGQQDSSLMKVFADAHCLIIRPPFAPPAPAGSVCDVLVLRP
ncbi:molybdopterin molybdotransferase MoeA [Hoeflea sp. YIM 152468]|uniref:molybdopterin molybdotransferase MoeA n=1 Tax=Hoeflea sp. YIM 152468 TaxID=3031759 RepID=UPI0023DA4F32|nr:gephyrin-like molybdotransferase Glp [Hoeflea sp. YIM 152468]MDF1607345.1 molybdopterin molybdotransferase MoeA [Hoeflea sp. YIM 152468]